MNDSELSFQIDVVLSIEFHFKWRYGPRRRENSANSALYRLLITLLQVPKEITLSRT